MKGSQGSAADESLFGFRARELALEHREAELKKAEAMAARTDAVESRALARVRSILTK